MSLAHDWTHILGPLKVLKYLTIKLGPDQSSKEACQATVQDWISTCPILIRAYLSIIKLPSGALSVEHICVWWERNRTPCWLIGDGQEKQYISAGNEGVGSG